VAYAEGFGGFADVCKTIFGGSCVVADLFVPSVQVWRCDWLGGPHRGMVSILFFLNSADLVLSYCPWHKVAVKVLRYRVESPEKEEKMKRVGTPVSFLLFPSEYRYFPANAQGARGLETSSASSYFTIARCSLGFWALRIYGVSVA